MSPPAPRSRRLVVSARRTAWARFSAGFAALVALLPACGGPGAAGGDRFMDAKRTSDAAVLTAITEDFWAEQMRHSPTWATYLGDRSRDGELGRASASEEERHVRALRGFSGRLALVNRKAISTDEQVTADALAFVLRRDVEVTEACRTRLWRVDQLGGPQAVLPELPNAHTVTTPQQGRDLVSRYQQVDEYFADTIAGLRDGLSQGLVASRVNVERVLRQVQEMLAQPVAESPFVAPVLQSFGAGGPPKGLGEPWKAQLLAAVEQSVYGGLRAYATFLEKELLPKARATVGVGALPIGAACYAASIEAETGVKLSPDAVFALGEAEVARISKEMAALVSAAGGGELSAYLKAIAARADQTLPDAAALLDYNRELMARAMRALPRAFGRLPKTVIEVKAIEAFRDKDAPAAYYYEAPQDASRPAYYYVNTRDPKARLLYKMPALAFHEAVPGHHLQIALAAENASLPVFQREMGQTAFTEGWALYAEGLADELGLYRTPDEKLGQLSYEMWRAVRLVVDAGLHAKGWTRQQAIDYLVAHTGHHLTEATNEVDRYIVWPGQALAYKVGELEIRKLRSRAQAALGPKFDLRAFHDALLGHGAVPLETAGRLVDAYIESAR